MFSVSKEDFIRIQKKVAAMLNSAYAEFKKHPIYPVVSKIMTPVVDAMSGLSRFFLRGIFGEVKLTVKFTDEKVPQPYLYGRASAGLLQTLFSYNDPYMLQPTVSEITSQLERKIRKDFERHPELGLLPHVKLLAFA